MGFLFLLLKGVFLVVFIFISIFVASFIMAVFGIMSFAFLGGFFVFLIGFGILSLFMTFHLFSLIIFVIVMLLLWASIRMMVKARIHEHYMKNKNENKKIK